MPRRHPPMVRLQVLSPFGYLLPRGYANASCLSRETLPQQWIHRLRGLRKLWFWGLKTRPVRSEFGELTNSREAQSNRRTLPAPQNILGYFFHWNSLEKNLYQVAFYRSIALRARE